MKLRIVAGELAGRRIAVPSGRATRPTAARVREAWFSALGDRLEAAHVADLFAGSGALGIEALSRGAAHAHFVESRPRVAAVLRQNLDSLDLWQRAELTTRDVFAFLAEMARGEKRFDLALADPPYASVAARRLAALFCARPFAALLCIEHAPGALGPEVSHQTVWHRRYGDTELTFLSASETETAPR